MTRTPRRWATDDRTRASAKAAGTRHERAIADYLATHVDDRVDRRVKYGSRDRGDIAGLRIRGQRIVVECKDTASILIGPVPARSRRGTPQRRRAFVGLVVAKRHVAYGDPADQVVLMTLRMTCMPRSSPGWRPE